MPDSIESLERLRFVHNDAVYLLPCTEVIAYWSGSLFDHADALAKFYRESISLIGDHVKFYRTETMGAARPVKKDSLELLPFWLKETDALRDVYMLFLESGDAADEPSEYAFAMNASPGRGYVRVVLPPSVALESPDRLREVAMNLMEGFDVEFGNAGLSVNWNYLGKNVRRSQLAMHQIAPRFQGVDMSYALPTQFIVPEGMKCINWLTFIGTKGVEALGGSEALASAVGARGTVIPMSPGVVVQAGDIPKLGDVNRQEDLSAYFAVGHALAPFRAAKHPAIFGAGGIPDEAVTNAWLARFDGTSN